MCTHHEPGAVTGKMCQMNHEIPTAQGRGVPSSPVTGTQPALTLQTFPWANQELGRLSQGRLCAAMTCTQSGGMISSPWAASGLHCDRDENLWVCPSSVLWWFWVVFPHYGTLDQKADEMEVLGRWLQTKSACGQTVGPDEGRNGSTVTPPLLPAPEKLSPAHKAEKKKKEGKH